MSDTFDLVEQTLRSGGSKAGFDFLVRKFLKEKNYPLLFEVRLMKKRHELGLPLIQTGSSESFPNHKRNAYEQGSLEAAREIGSLFLKDGKIPLAWPYFRAIGESAPVAAAIEKIKPQEDIDPIIEIAFYEQVHPRKGFELILANYGLCRAITSFGQYPGPEGREQSAHLLISSLHGEVVKNLKWAINKHEGQSPNTESIPELIGERDWLFKGNSTYTDSTHVASIVQLSLEQSKRETLTLALELTDYGRSLGTMFQFPGEPPFQNLYVDHAVYLGALLGSDTEQAILHFRNKVTEGESGQAGSNQAQVLVKLLTRLKRYPEAIEISLKYLRGIPRDQLSCPSIHQLCQLAREFGRLKELTREEGDLLNFTAATLQK